MLSTTLLRTTPLQVVAALVLAQFAFAQSDRGTITGTVADSSGVQHLPIGSTLDDYIRGQEKVFINETLKFNNGSREKTASMLGISIATLYRKMELNVERRTTS